LLQGFRDQTNLSAVGNGPGIQKACNPIPIASAASAAVFTPFFSATAQPNVYAHTAFSKAIG